MIQRQGQYIFLTENVYYNRSQIQEIVDGKTELYIQLTNHPFVKFNDQGLVAFSFVGIIAFNETIICFFPKYYREDSSKQNLATIVNIIKVLKRIGSLESVTPDFANFSTAFHNTSTELAIADQIIKDYLDYGLYTNEIGILELNQPLEIDWNETISRISPIFSRKRPIYTNTYSKIHNTSYSHLVTEVQKWALKYLLSKYGELLDYKLDFQEECVISPSHIGTAEFLKYVLSKELTSEFTDRKIKLIKLLINLLGKTFGAAEHPFFLYGTGYFHVIWEKVCAYNFSNEIANYIDKIPQPIWNDHDGNAQHKDSYRPDIVHFNPKENLLFILDAKYYDLKFAYSPFKISGNPGIGDVSKQFLYASTFEMLGFENILNILLFPRLQEELINVSGFVSFALFPSKVIWLCYLHPNHMYLNYINSETFNEETFETIRSAIRNRIA